jgi:probable HAF family extracellular repeat protein
VTGVRSLVLAVVTAMSAASTPHVSVTRLPQLLPYGEAVAVDNQGRVIGAEWSGGDDSRVVLWVGTRRHLLPGSADGAASDIGPQGTIVGYLRGQFPSEAVVWPPHAKQPTLLGTGAAMAINSRGTIVGSQRGLDVREHAYIWPTVGAPVDIGSQLAPRASSAYDIADDGTVVGEAWSGDYAGTTDERPFVFRHGRARPLPLPPGATHGGASSANARGLIVGWSARGSRPAHAVVWQGGSVRLLAGLPSGASDAVAVDVAGDVAGTFTKHRQDHAFWWHDGTVIDLGPGDVSGMNDRGQIVGSIDSRAVMWTVGAR